MQRTSTSQQDTSTLNLFVQKYRSSMIKSNKAKQQIPTNTQSNVIIKYLPKSNQFKTHTYHMNQPILDEKGITKEYFNQFIRTINRTVEQVYTEQKSAEIQPHFGITTVLLKISSITGLLSLIICAINIFGSHEQVIEKALIICMIILILTTCTLITISLIGMAKSSYIYVPTQQNVVKRLEEEIEKENVILREDEKLYYWYLGEKGNWLELRFIQKEDSITSQNSDDYDQIREKFDQKSQFEEECQGSQDRLNFQ